MTRKPVCKRAAKLVAQPKRIEGLEKREIVEYFGIENLPNADISVASCTFNESFSEGKKTILFDEYLIGLEGEMKVYECSSKQTFTCQAGQGLFLPKGDYEFHFMKSKYIAICAPAHQPHLVKMHKQ